MKYKESFFDNNEITKRKAYSQFSTHRLRLFWCLLLTAVIISLFGGYYYGIYAFTGGYNYYISYIIDKNETLTDLSKEFLPLMPTRIGIKKIMDANGISNSKYLLLKGDKLWIPTKQNLKPFYIALYDSIIGYNYFFEYEINKGDTLEALGHLMLPSISINEGIKMILSANSINYRPVNLAEIKFLAPMPKTKSKIPSTNNNVEETMSLNPNSIRNLELLEGIKLWIPTGRLAPYLNFIDPISFLLKSQYLGC